MIFLYTFLSGLVCVEFLFLLLFLSFLVSEFVCFCFRIPGCVILDFDKICSFSIKIFRNC